MPLPRRVYLCLSGIIVLVSVTLAQAPHALSTRSNKRLTNADVVQMVQAKLSDPIIIKAIQANDVDFDTSGAGLVKLKQAGASQAVLDAVLSAAMTSQALRPNEALNVQVSNSDLPQEVGVYLFQKGTYRAMEPEIVNWRTGGVLKILATAGLDKGHVNGTISGSHSSLHADWSPMGLAGPLVFYVRCPEGISAAEYQLLHLWTKGDRREFRAITGGVLHASGGASDNVVNFKYENVAPRSYKITVSQISAGEYGFLPPGAVTSSSIASNGKMFTFRIPE
ncbi:MAG TPA: hypothetical protein VHR84_18170 [Terriglobales bacterium]|jgi:hypothetical protein|nr:hypothetical protein [Terriglobales bacterium]